MRIGTWNIAGRTSLAHIDFALGLECDVLLLTEVNDAFALPGLHELRSANEMAAKRRWAAVISTAPLTPSPDPHPASAAAALGGITFCSTILPWRGCGPYWPFDEGNHATMTDLTLSALDQALPRTDLVWGGDFNHSFIGGEVAGSVEGRPAIQEFVAGRALGGSNRGSAPPP